MALAEGTAMKVLFVAGFGPIVRDREASRRLYVEDLGITLEADADGYLHTEGLDGVKTFALWPLSQAAQSCFGSPEWPAHVPVPQAWLEFDVDDIAVATAELRARGYTLLVSARVEPWGQTVTRLLAPEGILIGVTHTPSMRGGSETPHEEQG
jgi:catechol 2,3-dioxygenase-like lactoylglutathione lyase family enzyme